MSNKTPLIEQDIWKTDFVTRIYKREQGKKLNAPSKMSIIALADACTYCNNWDNPYARELIKRSGYMPQYNEVHRRKERLAIFDAACRHYGIKMF